MLFRYLCHGYIFLFRSSQGHPSSASPSSFPVPFKYTLHILHRAISVHGACYFGTCATAAFSISQQSKSLRRTQCEYQSCFFFVTLPTRTPSIWLFRHTERAISVPVPWPHFPSRSSRGRSCAPSATPSSVSVPFKSALHIFPRAISVHSSVLFRYLCHCVSHFAAVGVAQVFPVRILHLFPFPLNIHCTSSLELFRYTERAISVPEPRLRFPFRSSRGLRGVPSANPALPPSSPCSRI